MWSSAAVEYQAYAGGFMVPAIALIIGGAGMIVLGMIKKKLKEVDIVVTAAMEHVKIVV